MKRLATFLLVLFVLATLADFGARIVVQDLAGRALASHRGVNGSVDVSFGGWPFLLRLVDRRFTSVSVSAEDVRSGGFGATGDVGPQTEARLRSVAFDLRDVRIRGKVWGDDPDRMIAAAGGTGSATLSGAELNRLVPDEYAARVQLLENSVRVTAGGQTADVSEDAVRIDDGTLVVEAPAPLQPIVIPLPSLLEGTRFEAVDVMRGAMELTLSLTDVRLEL